MSSRGPRFRRNGKLFACEPCRKQKIRCDHALPACGRCTRRTEAKACVYDPAPLTRSRGSLSGIRTPPVPEVALESSPQRLKRPMVQMVDSSLPVKITTTGMNETPGFLGSTSFSDVFNDKHTSDVWLEDMAHVKQSLRSPPSTYMLPAERINSGAAILGLLDDFNFVKATVRNYFIIGMTAIVPWSIFEKVLDSVQITLQAYTTDAQRRVLASKIFAQTFIPLKIDENTTPENYHLLFTGDALRWEIMGVIYSYFVMGCLLEKSDTDRPRHVRELAHASNLCVSFSDQPESFNDPLVWLLHCNCVLLTFVYGDASHLAYRRLSHLADCIFAMGLHQDPSNQPKLPFFICQLRRRAFANAYSSDKSLSTFFGRPPRISLRYCSTKEQHDLSDDEITASPEVRDFAISRLKDGWNPDGLVHRSTWGRVKLKFNAIREEVLELSLGPPNLDYQMREKAQLIMDRLQGAWESVPDFIRYDHDSWTSGKPPNFCFALLFYYLGHKFSAFLLHRIIARHGGPVEDMFESAQELLAGILVISKHRDRITGLSRDFSWVSIFYGLPSAALLAIELLRQQQLNDRNHVQLPRAAIIRNISVFISSLDWVARPDDGNYGICYISKGNSDSKTKDYAFNSQGAKNMLEKILDSILNNHTAASTLPVTQPPTDPLVWVDEFFGDGWLASGPFVDSLATTDTQSWELDGNWPFEF